MDDPISRLLELSSMSRKPGGEAGKETGILFVRCYGIETVSIKLCKIDGGLEAVAKALAELGKAGLPPDVFGDTAVIERLNRRALGLGAMVLYRGTIYGER